MFGRAFSDCTRHTIRVAVAFALLSPGSKQQQLDPGCTADTARRRTQDRRSLGSGPIGRVQKIYSVHILFARSAKEIKRRFFGERHYRHLLIVIKIRNRNAGPAGISYLGRYVLHLLQYNGPFVSYSSEASF